MQAAGKRQRTPIDAVFARLIERLPRSLMLILDRGILMLPAQLISRWKTSWLLCRSLILLTLAAASCAAQQHAFDLDGRKIDPVGSNAGRVTVLIFVRQDCPVSGRYAPTIQRISDVHKTNVRFFLVFPDKSQTPSDIRKHLLDFRYSIPALRDPDHALVKQAHAQITPEAAVFDARGKLIYHGRIDNLYQTFGRSRPAPTTHELEDAIEAALTNSSSSVKDVPGVGCYISDLE